MTSAEKNSRKKIRISIIDVLIVIVFIACIGGIFVHYQIYEKNNALVTDDTCYVSVLFSEVPNELAGAIEKGDKVYRDGVVLGTVNEVTPNDASIYYTDSRNEIVVGSDPTKKDIEVVISVKGEMTEEGFLANGKDYTAAGMKIDVMMPNFSGNGLIFDVKQQSK